MTIVSNTPSRPIEIVHCPRQTGRVACNTVQTERYEERYAKRYVYVDNVPTATLSEEMTRVNAYLYSTANALCPSKAAIKSPPSPPPPPTQTGDDDLLK